jgi:hypothetical protein
LLSALAAGVITVLGVVFSVTIVALTLASQQFGPRMLRNFEDLDVVRGRYELFLAEHARLASDMPAFGGQQRATYRRFDPQPIREPVRSEPGSGLPRGSSGGAGRW